MYCFEALDFFENFEYEKRVSKQLNKAGTSMK